MTGKGHAFSQMPPQQRKLVRAHMGLLLSCAMCVLLAGTSMAVGHSAATTLQLPPFQIDPTLPQQIVINAEQGLGQCHWVDPGIVGRDTVSWAYHAGHESGWSTLEPQPGVYSWSTLDRIISKARNAGKRIWVGVHVTEGLTPQWAKDAGVQVVGTSSVPVPWNETYQRLLRRVVHAMAARYDNSDTVDAIVVAAGGCYGEMTICSSFNDEAAWLAAGYTDARFADAVKQIVDIYLEEDYEWEDGSHTRGFRNTPVMVQIGTGLYGQAAAQDPVLHYTASKYGMRVWFKYNGLGDGSSNPGRVYGMFNEVTRVGYEPVGTSGDFLNRPDHYVEQALEHHSSYLCLQDSFFDISSEKWQDAREMAARYLGAQIVHQGTEAPDFVSPGQPTTFVTNWVNRGTVPLMYPQRQGIKDIPASYEIEIAFVRPGSGVAAFEHRFVPIVPTTNWYSAQPVRIEEAITIPALPLGEYDLRVALVRPGTQPDDSGHYFRLVNTDLHDGSGRYAVGRITVVEGDYTPGPTRTRTPTVASSVTPVSTATRTPTGAATATPRTPTMTPSPSPTLPGGETTITLQQGTNGYTGSEDTYIYQYAPDANYCSLNALKVGYKQRYAALLHFDVSSIPADAVVTRASLQLYAKGWGGSDMTIDAHRILRQVNLCQGTWNQAHNGSDWGQPGCNDTFSDRRAAAESSVSTDTIWKWYSFDLASLVQGWVNGSVGNNGVLLRGASPLSTGLFYFASTEDGGSTRPKLVVTYHAADGPTPTQPATATQTPTPMASPTPTSTAAGTPTGTTVATLTHTPAMTPSATPTSTATRTSTLTPRPSPTSPGAETTIILQQGSNGYTGSEDSYVYQYEPDANFCSLNAFKVGYKQRYGALLRFDVSAIPANAVVVEASLQLYAKGWGGSDMTIDAHRILRQVKLCQTTWNQAHNGSNWGQPGCDDTYSDRRAAAESSVSTNSIWKWYDFDLTSLVQDWVTGSLGNNGVLLRGASPWSTGLFYFASTEDGASTRPKMVVTYIVPEGPGATSTATAAATRTRTPTVTATPTGSVGATATATARPTSSLVATRTASATATRTPTATPTPSSVPPGSETTVTLQQGYNGYAGCEDTYFYQYAPDANYCNSDAFKAGYKQRNAALLRFDLSPIPANATVAAATLELYAKGWGGVDTTLAVHRVLRPFDACQANWNQARSGEGWGQPGCNDTSTDRRATAESAVDTDTIWKSYQWDVTALVGAWVDGSVANNGMVLRGASSLSTGLFYFTSAESGAAHQRPKLVVTYRVPDGPSATSTATPTATRTRTPLLTATPTATGAAQATGTATATSAATHTPIGTRTATATPSPSPVPPGSETTITLQQGYNGYAGCEDTRMYAYAPDANYCQHNALEVGYRQRHASLVRFDVSSVPADALVTTASLQLYAKGWGGTDTTLDLHRLLRPFVACEATWNEARRGDNWGVAGCNDVATDRGMTAESSVRTDSIGKWYSFDITALVQAWVDGSTANHGVVLRGAVAWSTGKFYFASSEDSPIGRRPRLLVTYYSGVPPLPTATPASTPSPNLLAGPYVGNATTSSVAISWVAERVAQGTVRYGIDPSCPNQVTAVSEPYGDERWYSGIITGLQPATTYFYRVYNDGRDMTPWAQVTFTTAPDPAASSFSFAVLGDGRPGSASSPPSWGARNVASELAQRSVDLALYTGDMVYGGGICSGSDSAWQQYIRAYLNLHGDTVNHVPIFPCVGNHELNGGSCGYQSYTNVFQLPTNAPGGAEEQYYSFHWAGAHFIALDSTGNLHRGSPQYMWLVDELKGSTDEWKFVFFHHPAYSSGNHGSEPLLQEKLPPLFETYGVDAVFSGHDHTYERTCSILQGTCVSPSLGGVVYYVTGGAGAPLYAPGNDWFTAYSASVYHFLLVQVNDCWLRIDALNDAGTVFDSLTLDRCSSP